MKLKSFYIVRSIFLVILFHVTIISFSQEKGVITGSIIDDDTGEGLIGANLRVYKHPSIGAAADIDGSYKIELLPGKYSFIASYTGMQSDTFSLTIYANQIIEQVIRMKPYVNQLEGVEIRVGKFDKKLEEITVSMEIIQPSLIEDKNTTNIETILDYIPGLNILNGEPQIRGGSGFTFGVGSKVGVFVDDMPVLSGDANRPYWNLIPVENIEQIEVIKGAASVLSGASALSGSIYVKTKWPELKPRTKITVYGGLYNNPKNSGQKWWTGIPYMGGANYLHSKMINNTDFVIAANVNFDHGFEGPPVPGPYVVDTLSDFTQNQMAEQRIRMNFSVRHRNKKHIGLNYGIRGNTIYNKTKMVLAWLDDSTGFYRAYPGAVLLMDEKIFYLDPFINFYSNLGYKHSLKARIMHSDVQMSNEQANINTVYYTDYNFRKEYSFLNGLSFIGGLTSQYNSSHADMYGGSGSPDNNLLNFSGYAEIDFDILKVINLTAGIRSEYYSLNSNKNDLKTIYRMGASLKLHQETYIRASYGQGYRYPTIAERFVRLNLGSLGVFENPQLKPETSINAEVGIKQGFKFLNYFGYLDIAVFQQDYQNTVEYLFGFWDSTYTFAIGGFKFLNTGKSRIVGVDISLTGKAKLSENFTMNTILGYNYIMPKSLEPDYVFAHDYNPGGNTEFSYNSTSVNPENNILKYRFLHTLKGDIEFEYYKFAVGLSLKYFSKIVNLDKSIEDFEQATKNTGGTLQAIYYMDYFNNHNNGNVIMDIRMSYTLSKKHKIALLSNNITNRWYSLRPLKAEPMRTIMAQYTLNF